MTDLARYVHHAVAAQVDRAVRADQILAGDRLRAGRASQLHRYLRLAEDLRQLLGNGLGGLFDGHAAHADRAVGRAQVHGAFAFDQVEVVDGLVQERAHGLDLQHVVDLDAVWRQGHHFQHLDLQNVGRLDAIGGQRDHGLFPRRLHGRRNRRLQRLPVVVERTAAGKRRDHRHRKQQCCKTEGGTAESGRWNYS